MCTARLEVCLLRTLLPYRLSAQFASHLHQSELTTLEKVTMMPYVQKIKKKL
jgi:hypothetical protein